MLYGRLRVVSCSPVILYVVSSSVTLMCHVRVYVCRTVSLVMCPRDTVCVTCHSVVYLVYCVMLCVCCQLFCVYAVVCRCRRVVCYSSRVFSVTVMLYSVICCAARIEHVLVIVCVQCVLLCVVVTVVCVGHCACRPSLASHRLITGRFAWYGRSTCR